MSLNRGCSVYPSFFEALDQRLRSPVFIKQLVFVVRECCLVRAPEFVRDDGERLHDWDTPTWGKCMLLSRLGLVLMVEVCVGRKQVLVIV